MPRLGTECNPVAGRRTRVHATPGGHRSLLGSLDAIHLAGALLARALLPELHFATHDSALAVAAQAIGFKVLGVTTRRSPAHKA